MNTPLRPMRCIGSQSLTVDATAGGVALTLPFKQDSQNLDDGSLPQTAYISNEAQEARWKIDPAVTLEAAANGHVIAAGGFIWVTGTANIRNFRAIRTTANSATLRVTYFA